VLPTGIFYGGAILDSGHRFSTLKQCKSHSFRHGPAWPTIQKRFWPLKKSFINARQGVLDPPVKPEDDGG
jgi:hypothetical protein